MLCIFDAAQKGYKQARAERNRTVLEMKAVPPDSVCSSDMDRRNQENIARTGLGIRTSRDIFEAAQKGYEQARAERNQTVSGRKVVPSDSICSSDVDKCNQENMVRAGLGIRTSRDIFEATQKGYEQARAKRNQIVSGRKAVSLDSVCSSDVDRCNQENVARAGLGIRTSRDIFEATQKEYEQARLDKLICRQETRRQGSVASHEVVATTEEDMAQEGRVVGSTVHPPQRKRKYVGRVDQERPKRTKTVVRRERSDDEQMEDLASILRHLEDEFAEKERLSDGQEWCTPITLARKVSTVQEFYKAFHDRNTLPIYTCRICYRKFGRTGLQEVGWDVWIASHIEKRNNSPFKCSSCFPVGESIIACADCVKHLERGALSCAAQLHTQLGCEHMFPDELKGLTPVEEKLIALNSCYGFITK